ncbi:carbohydrate-binding module family 20 domain-containing protein [Streptomyces sp. ACA25]|uniref:carbohydrate-binding module family 20 domain-containing protein n=1 Tax=Streptomyces sp. ACA25 TaxID=3022596 RepID=UPI0023074776|nr:carbohydrate-binding module family 20 domain-containing protein [Streptomyces sp. ACA25]MDB1087875.1 carbohydrate-binding module family 20 domain-containing protein [Streptomyces sp. ACA25]
MSSRRGAGSGFRRTVRGTLAAVAAAAVAAVTLTSPPAAQAAPPGDKDVTAVLFSWNFNSIARECTQRLGPAGYGFVQVSPPQESIQGPQWWTQYQPVSYRIQGRLGNRAEFRNMVSTCESAGVGVIVDAVINHMSAGSGTGTAGSQYTKYNYPDAPYSDGDFNDCRRDIGNNYGDRYNVQYCELVGLADLRTSKGYVQQRIADYMNDLLSLGVAGFRVDAAKHMPTEDLAAIKSRLSDPNVFWNQEVIHGAGEAVQPEEYLPNGHVQEFRYATELKRMFQAGRLADLRTFGESWGFMPGGQSGVFVDNHDTERNGSTLSYKDGSDYTLANVFMLAWPYGSPDVHSGYEFSNFDAGPPNNGNVQACYQGGWKCQHAWSEIENMVGFRNATRGQSVTNWWDNGNDAVSFSRGNRGFVAINGESSSLTRTFQTSLPSGSYCNVQNGSSVSVNGSGQVTATLGAGTALALHADARNCTGNDDGDGGAAFGVNAQTQMGQNIYVVGNLPQLGSWNPDNAVRLDPADYPVWKGEIALPAGTSFEYKYIRRTDGGGVTWESGGNRTATVPQSGTVRLNDTWRS